MPEPFHFSSYPNRAWNWSAHQSGGNALVAYITARAEKSARNDAWFAQADRQMRVT
jgi:hypothetical protein